MSLSAAEVMLSNFTAYFKLLLAAYPMFCTTFLSSLFGCRDMPDGTAALIKYPAEFCGDDGSSARAQSSNLMLQRSSP